VTFPLSFHKSTTPCRSFKKFPLKSDERRDIKRDAVTKSKAESSFPEKVKKASCIYACKPSMSRSIPARLLADCAAVQSLAISFCNSLTLSWTSCGLSLRGTRRIFENRRSAGKPSPFDQAITYLNRAVVTVNEVRKCLYHLPTVSPVCSPARKGLVFVDNTGNIIKYDGCVCILPSSEDKVLMLV